MKIDLSNSQYIPIFRWGKTMAEGCCPNCPRAQLRRIDCDELPADVRPYMKQMVDDIGRILAFHSSQMESFFDDMSARMKTVEDRYMEQLEILSSQTDRHQAYVDLQIEEALKHVQNSKKKKKGKSPPDQHALQDLRQQLDQLSRRLDSIDYQSQIDQLQSNMQAQILQLTQRMDEMVQVVQVTKSTDPSQQLMQLVDAQRQTNELLVQKLTTPASFSLFS